MTQVEVTGQTGEQALAAKGTTGAAIRQGSLGELVVSELHGRYYQTNYDGHVFSGGMGLTSISNATFTVGGIGATTTPVAGVWNPSTSKLNLVILQATLSVTVTAAAATGPGGFVWAMSVGNTALTLGAVPLNRATLALQGSVAKDMTGVALTGVTNNVVVRFASALNGGLLKNVTSTETAVGQNIGVTASAIEVFDGALIIPPGGLLALLATTTPVAHSAASGLVWEEVAV